MFENELKNYLDENGKLKNFPSKWKFRAYALCYLASKFEVNKKYSEYDINIILLKWHVFNDPASLRRDLYSYKFFDRTNDGKEYWLMNEIPTPQELIDSKMC